MGRSPTFVVVRTGALLLALIAGWFLVFKILIWNSVVVHAESASIHRVFFDRVYVRFAQETFSLADFLTGSFFLLGGAAAIALSIWMTSRLRDARPELAAEIRSQRTFFRLAGTGMIWLTLDELFVIHETLSANLYVHDALFLVLYSVVGLAACLHWRRIFLANRLGLAVMCFGAAIHVFAVGLDFVPSRIWVPEEPLEFLAAGVYAIGMVTYAVDIVAQTNPFAALATSRRSRLFAAPATVSDP